MKYSIGEIFRNHGPSYIKANATSLTFQHRKVIQALSLCRTDELGYNLYKCNSCNQLHTAQTSCGNRHCPQCQGHKTIDWIKKQEDKLLPVEYFLMTFTIPSELRPLFTHLQDKAYRLLFEVSAKVIKEMMANEDNLGVDMTGFTSILHTWGAKLQYHPHLHVLLPGGGIDRNGRWKPFRKGFGLVVKKVSKLWRGKLLAALEKLVGRAKLPPMIFSKIFIVHSKSVGSGLNTIKYLSRYVFRVAIDNRRVISVTDKEVIFKYKHRYGKNNSKIKIKTMALPINKFIHKFLKHILPSGFVKVRHYGFHHSNSSMTLDKVRYLIRESTKIFIEQIREIEMTKPTIKHIKPFCKKCGLEMELIFTSRPKIEYKKTG